MIITVEDSNDEVPHFPFVLYTAKVLENAEAGTDFITLSAIDPDLRGQVCLLENPRELQRILVYQ